MSYLVLARRWRPSRFSDLVGQDVVVRTLRNALKEGRLAHAYLLCGIRGVGKTTIARLMAMAVNCDAPSEGEPCGTCPACSSIAAGSSLDVQEMDAASHTGVDDIREILDSVRYPPGKLRMRVYIIDEAHMLSASAFNALLKTLEEPPEKVLFILATTEPEKLPITVRSRCQRFDLRRLSVGEIAGYLRQVLDAEGIEADSAALDLLARAADGSVRDALSLAERVLAFSGGRIMPEDVRQALGLVGPQAGRELSDALLRGDGAEAIRILRRAIEQGYGPRQCLQALAALWHELACARVDPALIDEHPDETHRSWIARWKDLADARALDWRYQVLIRGLGDLGLADERQAAEMLLLRLAGLNEIAPVAQPEDAGGSGGMAPAVSGPEHGDAPEPDARDRREAEAPDEPDLPLPPVDAPGFRNWDEAVRAYAEVNPAIAALLEHVACLEFGAKVRLALDAAQQRTLSQGDRLAFAEWLGREVLWEARKNGRGRTLHEEHERRARKEEERLRRYAEQDPHVRALMREMGASLIDVRPPGASDDSTDARDEA